MNRRDLERIVGYVKSVENEICLDENIYRLSGVTPESLGYLPRPAKVLNRAIGRQRIVRCLAGVARLLWSSGGALMFFWREWRMFRAHLRRVGVQAQLASDITVCSGQRTVEVVSVALKECQGTWLTFPWASLEQATQGRAVDVFSLLDRRDLFHAFRLSVRAARVLAHRPGTRHWLLQGYTAYRWFCVYLALEKAPFDHLVTADHFDRWAVLVDAVVARKRLRARRPIRLTLVQHGNVRALNQAPAEEGRLAFSLRHKLRAVSQLFVFDWNSRQIFENDILSARCSERVDIHLYAPEISLVSLPAEYGMKILFVGHPICESIQIELFRNMAKQFNVTAYYKPHPTGGMSHQARSVGWTVIDDKKLFPQVDLLVSYPSTLVQEYAAQGVGAVVHSLQHEAGAAAGIFSRLQSELTLLACERIQP